MRNVVARFGKVAVLGVLAAGLIPVSPAFAGLTYQPDGQIAKGGGSPRGNDIYNSSGAGQTQSGKVSAGHSITFPLRVQDDGNTTDNFVVTGCASSGKFKVKYFYGPTNVTDDVTHLGLVTPPVSAGSTDTAMSMRLKAGSSAHSGSSFPCAVQFRSVGDSGKTDTVKGVLKVK